MTPATILGSAFLYLLGMHTSTRALVAQDRAGGQVRGSATQQPAQMPVIMGLVVQEDGSPLPSGIVIERNCYGEVTRERQVDATGRKSESPSVLSDPRPRRYGAARSLPIERSLVKRILALLVLSFALLLSACFAQDVPQRYHGMAEISLQGRAAQYAAVTSESLGSDSWRITFTVSELWKEWEGDVYMTVAGIGDGRVLAVIGGYNASITITPCEPEIRNLMERGAGIAKTAMTHVAVRNLPDEGYVEILTKGIEKQ